MKLTKVALSVSALALMAAASQAFAADAAYNPATVVDVNGTVTSVRQVASGPVAGVHLMMKSKSGAFDVYLAPADFMKFLKADITVGSEIQVEGSRVVVGNADVLLARQVDDGNDLLTLRSENGSAAWQNWGAEVDPAVVQ